MKEAYGDKVGNTVYEVCNLSVSLSSFKIPDVSQLAKVPSHTVVNTKFNIVKNNITSITGINGLKNFYSNGWNVRYTQVGKLGHDIYGYVQDFIKIFTGRE